MRLVPTAAPMRLKGDSGYILPRVPRVKSRSEALWQVFLKALAGLRVWPRILWLSLANQKHQNQVLLAIPRTENRDLGNGKGRKRGEKNI
jgi:hypothetical protein